MLYRATNICNFIILTQFNNYIIGVDTRNTINISNIIKKIKIILIDLKKNNIENKINTQLSSIKYDFSCNLNNFDFFYIIEKILKYNKYIDFATENNNYYTFKFWIYNNLETLYDWKKFDIIKFNNSMCDLIGIVSKSISNYISLIPSTRHSNLIYYTY
jgi:hypothetical protein